MDFEIVSKEECIISGDREEMYSKLEQDLIGQVGGKYFEQIKIFFYFIAR